MNRLTSYPNPLLAGWRFPPGVDKGTLWYRWWHQMTIGFVSTFFGVRVFDRCYEPAQGSAVYICNHQSFLDPPLMGMALRRPMNYMARESLFFPPFGAMIRSVNAFPVKRNMADTGAMKEGLRRLKAGGQLVVFAEGTRTLDGRIGPLLAGASLFSQRAADWTVPVVIEGAFECWPRWQLLPRLGSIVVRYGRPIPRAEAKEMEPHALLDRIRRTMIEMQADLRNRLGKKPLEY
jgi:1-acyl-sn-glycerol-3-phosphate acyltransferase